MRDPCHDGPQIMSIIVIIINILLYRLFGTEEMITRNHIKVTRAEIQLEGRTLTPRGLNHDW